MVLRAPWCLTVTCSVLVSPQKYTKIAGFWEMASVDTCSCVSPLLARRWLHSFDHVGEHVRCRRHCSCGGNWLLLHRANSVLDCDVQLVVLWVKEATFPCACRGTCEVSTPLIFRWELALQHCANSVSTALDMSEDAAMCPGSSSTQCLVRQRIHILRQSLGLGISHIFHVMVNSDLEVASCLTLHCHGDVCSVDAPVALLSGSTWKY